jgi:hypothetical protein
MLLEWMLRMTVGFVGPGLEYLQGIILAGGIHSWIPLFITTIFRIVIIAYRILGLLSNKIGVE